MFAARTEVRHRPGASAHHQDVAGRACVGDISQDHGCAHVGVVAVVDIQTAQVSHVHTDVVALHLRSSGDLETAGGTAGWKHVAAGDRNCDAAVDAARGIRGGEQFAVADGNRAYAEDG